MIVLARIRVLGLVVLVSAVGTPAGQQVSGQVSGLQGNDHVVIKARGPVDYRATTRSAGVWAMAKVRPGTYTITPIHARYAFEPSQRVVKVKDKPVVRVDFSAAILQSSGVENPGTAARTCGGKPPG